MRALVTGATGFVGSHLVERLLAAQVEVMCLLRPSSRVDSLAGLPLEFARAAENDVQAIAAALKGKDLVFHVAGLTRSRTLAPYMAANKDFTCSMLEATIDAGAGGKKFIYVSSLAAAGPAPTPQPLDETYTPQPIGHYGISKLEAERACLAAADKLDVTIIRPPAVYGPRDTNFLPMFRTAAKMGIVPLVASGKKQLSLVHVSDLVEGIYQAACCKASAGKTYFISGSTHTFNEFADALAVALEKPLRKLIIPGLLARLIGEVGELKWLLTGRPQIICRRKMRDALQDRWICTDQRARADFGFSPKVDLVTGLRHTARWYIEQGFCE